jgi:predicted ribosome quality control (RQC) complex YloA/Tae2 family protein
MPFDGITVAALVAELKAELVGGRVTKVAQPEPDELILTIKAQETRRLLISANASLPLLYLTENNKPGPATAPGFCMLLRKYMNNGRIIDITQPGLERIVHFHIGHRDEMGDYGEKKLIVEIMGKHSNIIFVNGEDVIIDSIKHVSGAVSSVREVLPGRPYFVAGAAAKADPLMVTEAEFAALVTAKALPLHEAVYTHFMGISPVMAQELCWLAGLDGDAGVSGATAAEVVRLYAVLAACMEDVKAGRFTPTVYHRDGEPFDFAVLPLTMWGEGTAQPPVSFMLEDFYRSRAVTSRIRQKSGDLRRIVQTALERNRKKYDLQLKQISDATKKDKYRVYGELINTYGYGLEPGAKSLAARDYNRGEDIIIPLDPLLTAGENAKKYFEKYNKLKRTAEALATLTKEVEEEIAHLESIAAALDIAQHEDDLTQIKEEMVASGYIRRKGTAKKEKAQSRPFHYISSDGFHIYVGKNNFQNEEITFGLAEAGDWWFHAKGLPGSHVVVKTEGKELPDRTFEEAAALAAYYSRGREQEKVEVDYTERRNVKKPNGSKPGFVVYYTNYSLVAVPKLPP